MKKAFSTKKIILGGLFVALAYILPYLTGNLGALGQMISPMHLPILLCGFVCGGPVALIAGLVSPILRSALVGMPPMFPTAIAMAFELAAYGFFAGFFYNKLAKKTLNIYISLILSMLCGRVVWGVVSFILYGIQGTPFTLSIFFTGAFVRAVPAIILQIVIIPLIVIALKRAKILKED
ncbi:MAG: ECF transporter S component [Oscillospiraceae bacterium]